MSDFLTSIKADLLDPRLRVVAALVIAGLIAAFAYALLGGGGSTPATPSPSGSGPALPALPGIAASAAPSASEKAVAETTSGSPKQGDRSARNVFAPLPGASVTIAAPTAAPAAHSGAAATSKSTKGPSESSSPTGKAAPTTPKAPAKKHVIIHYSATAEFGVVPPPPAPGAPGPPAQLKTYKDMKLNEPLPSKDNSQLVYLGVLLHTGKDAVFELTGEAILHGTATCLPSPVHCQAIELAPGQSERLESVEANGTPVTYELKLLGITRSVSTAATARAHAASSRASRASKAGRALLRRAGLAVLPGARHLHDPDVLVVRPERPHGTRRPRSAPQGH